MAKVVDLVPDCILNAIGVAMVCLGCDAKVEAIIDTSKEGQRDQR